MMQILLRNYCFDDTIVAIYDVNVEFITNLLIAHKHAGAYATLNTWYLVNTDLWTLEQKMFIS